MILSSINFIKASTKPKLETDSKFTDFIIEKIKEEQDRRDAALGIAISPCPKKTEENKKKEKTIQSKMEDPPRVPPQHHELTRDQIVSVETGDGYYFSYHNMYKKLVLSDTESPNKNCIFRQKHLHVPDKDGEKKKMMVAFHLNHDQTKYISVGTDKRIEISVTDAELDPENPDGRFFVIHEIDNGMVFVQPYHHKGCYFHHIDNELTVSKFELNYRPPEEFFFKINKINVFETEMSSASSLGSSVATEEITHNHATSNSHHQQQGQISRTGFPQRQKSQNVKNSAKHSQKPSLFRGCFGLVSKEEKRQKKKC